MSNKINELERRRIDRVFHTLESKKYECHFLPDEITVYKGSQYKSFPIEQGVARATALKNTAKLIAHHYGLRYNQPMAAKETK